VRLLPALLLLFGPLLCNGQAASDETVIQGPITPLNITPTFNHGYLAAYDRDGVHIYAPDGTPSTVLNPKGVIVNVDIDTDGSLAAAIEGSQPSPGLIALFTSKGFLTTSIDTGAWHPSNIVFAPDHSIWALGSEEYLLSAKPDYFILRHYSPTGDLLSEFVPRSAFPAESNPGQIFVGLWGLRAASGRLGMILRRAGDKKSDLWLETDLNGKEIGRWSGTPRAFADNGSVYAPSPQGLTRLDKLTGAWTLVAQASKDVLLGAEGNTLVFLIRGTNNFRREPQP
jgi:hypothetical protein